MTYLKTFFCSKRKKKINVFSKRISKAKYERMCLGITRGSRVVSTLVPAQINRTEAGSNNSSDHNNSQMNNNSPLEVRFEAADRSDETLRRSLEIFHFAKKNSVSRNAFNGTIEMVNDHIKAGGSCLYSHYKARKELLKRHPVKTKKYDVCKKGCKLYAEDDTEDSCSHCGQARYKPGTNKVTEQAMTYLPLIEQLALLVNHPETANLLEYPVDRRNEESILEDADLELPMREFMRGRGQVMSDIFDGKLGQRVIQHFENQADKDLYLVLNEAKVLEKRGFKMMGIGKLYKAYILFAGGDLPATAKMAGLSGHSHLCPCKICLTVRRTVNKKHVADGINDPFRTKELFSNVCINNGQRYATPFAELSTFHGPLFFPIDLMHLIGCKIGPQMHRLMITNHYDADSSFANPLKLTNRSIDDRAVDLAKSHLLVPTSFSGSLQNFAFKAGYNRAVDWIHFMKYSMSTTMLHHFENDPRDALIAVSQICNIVTQREIDKPDLTLLKRCINKWPAWLASSVKDKKLVSWVFGIYQHLLTYLARTIICLGPIPSYSAFNMETTIGQFKKAIKSRKNLGTNTGNVLVASAAEHDRERTQDTTRPLRANNHVLFVDTVGELDYEVWGPFKTLTLQQHNQHYRSDSSLANIIWIRLLQDFFRHVDISSDDLSMQTTLQFGSQLLTTKDIVIDCYTKHVVGNRHSYFVKLCLRLNTSRQNGNTLNTSNRTYFGEALIYFNYDLANDDSRLLALVNILPVNYERGHIWPYKTPSAKPKLKIVSVKFIVALCGRSVGMNEREYSFWHHVRKYEHIPLGTMNLL
ncbi:hypothetical protein BCV72DRAFT_323507 [Rhizopus microsporus var. microsporus]|uniref:Uncharacterized protein n=1 Tax=Rhizopus microsporus var. microsporus TaxID=86635 RepID=A0A1X0QMN2_RHIZD|nr:hypothetical protein BCV72DRAFT_323507 [Rhizopus microsporus var. microsporus]